MTAYTYTGFLPAKKLNLLPDERNAFIWVLRQLENGGIDDEHFRMDKVWCGSVGCIAGHAAQRMNVENHHAFFNRLHDRSSELNDLLVAWNGSRGWMETARAKHAARALRSFLKTGKAHWRKAMGKDA